MGGSSVWCCVLDLMGFASDCYFVLWNLNGGASEFDGLYFLVIEILCFGGWL